MPRIRPWDEKVKRDVYLDLVACEDGDVNLITRRDDGTEWMTLVRINPKGHVRRIGGVDPNLGFDLDNDNRLKDTTNA